MKKLISALTFTILMCFGAAAFAQIGSQPPVIQPGKPVTPLSKNLHRGMAFEVLLSNFGFGVGGQYRQVISPMTELTADLRITGLKNVSEQTISTYFGQETPHKFNRVLAFPFSVGIRHRIFAKLLDDNFRVHLAAAIGPSMAFVYPYFKDYNQNGVRDYGNMYLMNGTYYPIPYTGTIPAGGVYQSYEPVNDMFSDWKDGHLKWGTSGQLVLSVDLGKFKNIGSINVGYYFHYYPGGIQMLEPKNFVLTGSQTSSSYVIQPANAPQKYFGSPIISFSFGGMW
ncbi:MAG TPA: hypothetical protein VKA08_18535 [Balneolales bacterium]|nr:hypothetical protein [Balneolales bacterium]